MQRWEKNQCSFKQAKLLSKHGLPTDVSRTQAREWIDKISANGWHAHRNYMAVLLRVKGSESIERTCTMNKPMISDGELKDLRRQYHGAMKATGQLFPEDIAPPGPAKEAERPGVIVPTPAVSCEQKKSQ